MTRPPPSITDALFAGIDLSDLAVADASPSSPPSESPTHRRQRHLAAAIRSGDIDEVRNAASAFPSSAGIPAMLRGERAAEILASHFSKEVAEVLVSAGLQVPTTITFLSYLHKLGDVRTLDWFLQNTHLGRLAKKGERSYGRMTEDAFFRQVRGACWDGNHELAVYYMTACHLTKEPRQPGNDRLFDGPSSPLLEAALRTHDRTRFSEMAMAIDRHGVFSRALKSTLSGLEWNDLLFLQDTARKEPSLARIMAASFPMEYEASDYNQASLVLLGLPVHNKAVITANDIIESLVISGAPALVPILAHPGHGARVASFLVAPGKSEDEARCRLSWFSHNIQETRLVEVLPHLYRCLESWRDSAGNNVGHYLAARPTSDPRQEKTQKIGYATVASFGPGARGEMLVQHAKTWCLEENASGKTPLYFIAPKARSQLTRQMLREVAAAPSPAPVRRHPRHL